MSDPPFGPYAFNWTPEEARVAAARAALRAALSGGLTKHHLAPLAAFGLALAFTAILALTGLITRRHGEIALLLQAAAFMAYRLNTRRRFLAARRSSAAAIEAMRASGKVVADIDEEGVRVSGGTASTRWNFADGLEVEDAGGMIYIWPRAGTPAFLPTRIFTDEGAARGFVAFAHARIAVLSRPRPLRPTP